MIFLQTFGNLPKKDNVKAWDEYRRKFEAATQSFPVWDLDDRAWRASMIGAKK